MQAQNYKAYRVWDLPTRLFHWLNFILVLLLFLQGLMIVFRHELGLEGQEAKLGLKQLHVILGYLFALNLLLRLVWAFAGNRYARWAGFVSTRASFRAAWPYMQSLLAGPPAYYVGHNPAGRIAVTGMFLLMLILAVTGIIRAGTDFYYPPLGGLVAAYVAADGVDPGRVTAESAEALVNRYKYRLVSRYKIPFGVLHTYTSYLLMLVVVLHVAAVIVTENRKSGLVSAMISGVKLLPADQRPVDADRHNV
jgi:Ni/Fe-hydrogenase 1 B-type cytochrome subunit